MQMKTGIPDLNYHNTAMFSIYKNDHNKFCGGPW